MGSIKKTKTGWEILSSSTDDAISTINRRISSIEGKIENAEKLKAEERKKIKNLHIQIANAHKRIEGLSNLQKLENEISQLKKWAREFEESLN